MSSLESIKAEILSRITIVDVVRDRVSLRQRGGRWIGLCPFHSEKTPSFHVIADKGFFKCFGCGRGGDAFTFIQLAENVDFKEALRILADRAGVEMHLTGRPRPAGEPGRADVAKVCAWALTFFRRELASSPAAAHARQYVAGRNISGEIAERFGLGFAAGDLEPLLGAAQQAGFVPKALEAADLVRTNERGLYCTFRNRLMFPIHDVMNRTIGFGGRTLADDPAKYLNTRQNALFDKGRNLYGIHLARGPIGERKRSILVEGYTDCLAAHQAGFTETVATLGTALTDQQVDLLRRYAETVVVLFDADAAGDAAAERAIRVAMPRHLTVKLTRIPDGKDPAEFFQTQSAEKFMGVLNSAEDALEFKWRRTRQRFGEEADGRRRREAVDEVFELVADALISGAVPDVDRGTLLDPVARIVHMTPDEAEKLLREHLRRRRPSGRTAPEGASSRDTRPTDAEQAGLTQILEVLLNEPALLETCREVFEPDRLADARDRRIGQMVRRMADDFGEFHLSEVLSLCEEPDLAARVTDLATRRPADSDFAGLIEAARFRLEEIARRRLVDDNRSDLALVGEHARRGSRFLGARKSRVIRTLSGTGAEPGPPPSP